MAEGVDVSWVQGNYVPGAFGESFVIVNASRANVGLAVGSYYHQQVANARARGMHVGHYFFNGNISPTVCADFFVNNLVYQPGDSLWLDVESEGGTGTAAWSPGQTLEFINRVKFHGLPTPGVYLNQSLMNGNDWSAVVATGAALWLAAYTSNLPAIRYWPTATLWQYTSSPIDRNRTVGAVNLAALGGATPIVEEEDMGLPISFVKDAKSDTIFVVGPTGKRAGIRGMYHYGLLQRAQKNKADDPMLVAELDIVASYLTPLAAVDVATTNVSITDTQIAALAPQVAELVAAKIAAAPHEFNITLTGKAAA